MKWKELKGGRRDENKSGGERMEEIKRREQEVRKSVKIKRSKVK